MTESDQERTVRTAETAFQPYRVMLLTSQGQVVRTQGLAARNDDQALRLAKSMMNGHAIDLWNGLRFMEHFATEKRTVIKQPQLLQKV